jgi:hypothetical protein
VCLVKTSESDDGYTDKMVVQNKKKDEEGGKGDVLTVSKGLEPASKGNLHLKKMTLAAAQSIILVFLRNVY